MRLVHLSDLHLGYRQYQRLTPTGINQREADVAATFKRAIDQTITLAPDLVVVAGDIFHNVRPTNQAILHAFAQFGRLRRALPGAAIVMVAGNHDSPKTSETLSILRLFRDLGIDVALDAKAERFAFPEHDLSVLAVPDVIEIEKPSFSRDPSKRYNVLVLHGEVEGMLPPEALSGGRASLVVTRQELNAAQWDYIALGHYHVNQEVFSNGYYSGSLDYTSANPWGEMAEERRSRLAGKGIIERDLDTGDHTFHHIPASRPLIDLPELSVRGLPSAEVDVAIRAAVEACDGGIDDRIVRLVVRDVPRHVVRGLDQRALREYKRRALHFHLDTRRPELVAMHGHGAPGRRPSLADLVREKLQVRLIESDIDRAALVELGLHYLNQTAESDPVAAMSESIE